MHTLRTHTSQFVSPPPTPAFLNTFIPPLYPCFIWNSPHFIQAVWAYCTPHSWYMYFHYFWKWVFKILWILPITRTQHFILIAFSSFRSEKKKDSCMWSSRNTWHILLYGCIILENIQKLSHGSHSTFLFVFPSFIIVSMYVSICNTNIKFDFSF